MPTPHDSELVRAAFRDVHATRLHGFALLVALGDRASAAAAAREALADGTTRLTELRHPERAAAWLRAHVVRGLRPRLGRSHASTPSLAALAPLGVDDVLLSALSSLGLRERAALVASSVERFDALDVALILGVPPAAARRAMANARRRFLEASAAEASSDVSYGPLTDRVLLVAARGFAPRASRSEVSP